MDVVGIDERAVEVEEDGFESHTSRSASTVPTGFWVGPARLLSRIASVRRFFM
jgi:hypothetical protein